MKLSILDQSPIYEGETPFDAFQRTIQLAQLAEGWGYHRFWVSEHHDSQEVAGSSPEVLISHLLAKTKHIRIGSGGVMLQHYSPYKVAENFNVLANLGPNRIDLGIGKAPGGLPHSTNALQQNQKQPSLENKLRELKHFIHNGFETTHPLYGVKASPNVNNPAELFLLGASESSAKLAASLQIPFVFAKFINDSANVLEDAISIYRQTYSAPTSYLILAVSVIVADTEVQAQQLASHSHIYRVQLESGTSVTLGTKEKAHAFGQQSNEAYTVTEEKCAVMYGTKKTIREKLLTLQKQYQIDEFILLTHTRHFLDKVRSYELLRDAFNEQALLS